MSCNATVKAAVCADLPGLVWGLPVIPLLHCQAALARALVLHGWLGERWAGLPCIVCIPESAHSGAAGMGAA